MNAMRILVVDDDPISRNSIQNFIVNYLGHEVTVAGSSDEAFDLFQADPFPLVISDIRMPGMDGIGLLKALKKIPAGKMADVVMVTGHGELESSVAALRAGAYDYLLKPINIEELAAVIERVAEHQTLLKENTVLKEQFKQELQKSTRTMQEELQSIKAAYSQVVGIGNVGIFSAAMEELVGLTQKLHKDRSIPVLIEGETGTGKEVIARMIHYHEGENTQPFITVNCSAITPTLFESELFGYERGAFTGARATGAAGKLELAQGGTIFLDEIGDLPLDLQPKLLRVIQQREFYRIGGTRKITLDVRIICATNRVIPEMIEQHLFRKDLYYRLNIGRIEIPPLRQRRDEIKPLATMFLQQAAQAKGKDFRLFHPQALKVLCEHHWPGNVRELQNAMERVVLLYDDVEVKVEYLTFLGPHVQEHMVPAEEVVINLNVDSLPWEAVELKIINQVMKKFDGNKSQAARFLNISRNRLLRKLKA
jgi:DNA-binding NtrC family response regulator